MRIFLGVFPPPQVQMAAAELIERLRRPQDGVSWVKQDNLHYTLRFLGELGESGAGRAAEAAVEAASHHPTFDAGLGSLGAFPNPRKARVLWVGMSQGAEPLLALARDVEEALQRHGFDRADRPFAPHLTIGRIRERDQDWSTRLAEGTLQPEPRFRVDRVVVVHSTLSPKGSIYEVRAEALLVKGA